MPDLLNIGKSALLSLQQSLSTTGHNIANVNTEGYSRQIAEFQTQTPQLVGDQYIGSGVRVSSIERAYDQFLVEQVFDHASSLGYFEAHSAMVGQVDDLMGDANAGLANALQQFFDSIQSVANNPGSIVEREILLGNAQVLADRFQFLDQRLDSLGVNATARVSETVSEINDLAERIARLNSDIDRVSVSLDRGSPNDLLDERDRLLSELSQKIGITVHERENGSVNVMIGSGQPLVIGANAQSLTVAFSATQPGQLDIGLSGVNGTSVSVTNVIKGGELQGYVDFRSKDIDSVRNSLGLVAMSITETFNTQHRLGMDLNNLLGGDFFVSSSPSVVVDSNNTGAATVTVSVDDVTALDASDYRVDYDGTQWRVTRTSDNSVTPGAGPFVLDGITINVAGAPAAGDTFLVRPVHDASGQFSVGIKNGSTIAAASSIRSNVSLANTGSGTISEVTTHSATGLPLASVITLTFNPDAFGVGVPGYDVSGGPAGPLVYDPATDIGGKSFALVGFGDISFTLSGNPQAGDTIIIESNTGAAGDNRNALSLAGLQSQQLFNKGTASYGDLYGQLVADVGVTTRQSVSGLRTETLLMDRALSARDSVSGVNLEEEAANLLRFQQAYQAAARVVSAAGEMFQTLLNATGR